MAKSKKKKPWVLIFTHPDKEAYFKAKGVGKFMWDWTFSQKYETEKQALDALSTWEKGGGNIGGWIRKKSDGWECEVIYKE